VLTDADDIVNALDGNDYIDGGAGNDVIHGNSGDDILFGNIGDDVLFGEEGNDYLLGGQGYDYYITDNGDTVEDSDGSGTVIFSGADLTGTKKKIKNSDSYHDRNNTYTKTSTGLVVTSKASNESIIIASWNNNDLGIVLQESEDVEVTVGEATALEAEEMMRINISLQRALEEGESITVDLGYWRTVYQYESYGPEILVNVPEQPKSKHYDSYYKTWVIYSGHDAYTYTYRKYRIIDSKQVFVKYTEVTFNEGEQEQTYVYRWNDNDIPNMRYPLSLTAKANDDKSNYVNDIEVIAVNTGIATIIDDDESGRYDPLVIDSNKDGYIATIALDDSTTYFDITGDGLRERVGWVAGEDALVVFDKNDNGKIDGVNELFGNLDESGFQEIKRLIDSNHDNKIDRKDELFNRLQLWHDYNEDAKVQEGELSSFKSEGVTSIDLNLVETEIDINGNLITEASKYTDSEGNRELIVDIQLSTDAQDTKVDIADILDFSIDETTYELPLLKGSGLVYDSFIVYNLDPEFKGLTRNYTQDILFIKNDFEGYVEQWSGYTRFMNELKERYSLENDFTMHQSDKEAWIAERFSAKDNFSTKIEDYYKNNLNNGVSPTRATTNDANIRLQYTATVEKIQSSFAILSFFKDEFTPTHYEIESDRFIIDDTTQFNTNIINYFNNSNTIEEKTFLAQMMQRQQAGLDFEIDTILDAVENKITQELIRSIFVDRNVIIGNENDEIIFTDDSKHQIILNKGDDKLLSGTNHDTFFYRIGDGYDVIQDNGGTDQLLFDSDISRDDVIVKLINNKDLHIGLKQNDVAFEDLVDKIVLVDWITEKNRVEIIKFGDGQKLDFSEILVQFEATDEVENLQLSSGNNVIDTKGGNDVVKAKAGNDTIIGGKGDDILDGGIGNDTYIYSRGDGKDTISDEAGRDILQFSNEITQNDLIVKFFGSDLILALKEEGKEFDELSDVITLKNYKNSKQTIEDIFLDNYQRVDIQTLLNAPTQKDDILELSDKSDIIDLLAGNDTVFAAGGNDTITGGRGNDILEGGAGNDTYIFNRGDGKDTIKDDKVYGNNNARQENAGNDTLQFGEGISAEDIIVKYLGSDLILSIKENGKIYETLSDVITIKNYTNENNKIENVLLFDGSEIVIGGVTNGTGGADYLSYIEDETDLVIQGLAGADFIHTGSGHDNVQGNTGTDDIYTGAGNDIIVGGEDSDFLAGGAGNDKYIFNRGDGADIILDDNRPEYQSFAGTNIKLKELFHRMDVSDVSHQNGGNDTIEFGEGITKNDITSTLSGNDLILTIAGGKNDSITIKNHLNSKNMIENIVLSTGEVVDLFASDDGDDNIVLGDADQNVDAQAGNDVVSTSSGDDIIKGGLGDDLLKGGSGDDTYFFNRGDGQDIIDDDKGNDTLEFAEGTTPDDIIVKLINKDLFVAIKEENKVFSELSDKIKILNHTEFTNKLETILFHDGTVIDINTFLYGTDENDTFEFTNVSTVIDAQAGNDVVVTGYDDDTIAGGKGSDTLKGGAGNDTYIYERGDGIDTITDDFGSDILQFGVDITSEDLLIKLEGRDLIVALKEEDQLFSELSDKVTFVNHTNKNNKLEIIVFSDGSDLDLNDVEFSTLDDDNFIFGSGKVDVNLLEGNDNVSSSLSSDTLIGGLGDDTLKGGAGSDTLAGSEGTDRLEGGRENDLYIFNRGDSVDTIYDFYHGYDVDGGSIVFDKDIATGKLVIKVTGQQLIDSLVEFEKTLTEFATNFTDNTEDNLDVIDIMMKIVDGDLVIALLNNGHFENWNNKVTFKQVVSDDGLLEFSDGVSQGNLDVVLEDGDLVISSSEEDKIVFHNSSNAGNDTLQLGEGITKEDVLYKYVGNDLILALKEENRAFDELQDKIILENYVNANNKIETILFYDQTKFDFYLVPEATENDDNLVFSENDITIDALAGNDIIETSSGNDTLFGNSGDDTLISGVGSDTIIGGLDNDILKGGLGNDTYIFNRGDGNDIIFDSAGSDSIEFGAGIIESDLIFQQNDYNLTIFLKVEGTPITELTDSIVITDWFKTRNNIETIKFEDGSELKASIISGLVLEQETDILLSNHGADILGGLGDDTYIYRKDDFTVIIDDKFTNKEIAVNAGNDTLKFDDIYSSEVTIGIKGSDLIIKIDADHDTYTELKDYVVIRDWQDENRGIESIVFADGEVFVIDKSAQFAELEFDENWITGRYYIYGSEDNVIEGTNFSEVIESGAGNDTITALNGSDFINAGLGDDVIDGGAGNDTYVFNLGDGTDIITDTGGVDTVKFGQNISQENLFYEQVDNDLVFAIKDGTKSLEELNDKVILKNWFDEETITNRIELIVLENEGTIAIADFIIAPTIYDDDLEYGDENNKIDALAGDDIIHIGGGNDILFGNDGDDTLYAEAGDDTISGDSGADLLYGHDGNDTYLFGRGDGHDIIIEDDFTNWNRTGNDTLKFKDGVTASDLILLQDLKDIDKVVFGENITLDSLEILRYNNNLRLAINETNSVTIENWFSEDDYKVDFLKFSDGSEIAKDDLVIGYYGNKYNNKLIGSLNNENIFGLIGNDTLSGGAGNDILDGGSGNDLYLFNLGDGYDTINNFSEDSDDIDKLVFGKDITLENLEIQRYDNNLQIIINEMNIVTISNWFLEDDYKVDFLTFGNGTEIAKDDLVINGYGDVNYMLHDSFSTDNILLNINHTLEGIDDNITLSGSTGDDVLDGGIGDDILHGQDGNDLLVGGRGNDILDGGFGDDRYLFNIGDGHDKISNYSQNSEDLIVALKEDGKSFEELSDKITLKNWSLYDEANSRDYSREFYTVENFSFSDGSSWNMADIISNIGSDESETIYGFNQNDTLNGKKGNDVLSGRLGDDTYVFNKGDGHDTIYDFGRKYDDYSYYDAGNDTLKFGEGITENDLFFKKIENSDDIIIYLREGDKNFSELQDSITLKDWFISNNRIENMTLFDGSEIDYIKYIGSEPTQKDDRLIYGDDNNVVDALAGNDLVITLDGDDIVDGNLGDDTLESGTGNDTLFGGEGNDTLDGGAGNDTLDGGLGDDIYLFNLGDGHDKISSFSVNSEAIDKVMFGEGITLESLEILREDNDLKLSIDEANSVTIQNWFLEDDYKVDFLTFSDGSEIAKDDLVISYYGDENDNTLIGTLNKELIFGLEGNDTLYGGAGNDTLDGGSGDDLYLFNLGDGHDGIINLLGSNTLKFGSEVDPYALLARQDGNDLIFGLYQNDISFNDFNDLIRIKDWFILDNDTMSFVLDNGMIIGREIIEKYLLLIPTDGDDILIGSHEDDVIEAKKGNDTLVGDLGNDILKGGTGNDTYLYNFGDGIDTIIESSGEDTIHFGSGVTKEDLIITSNSIDLVVFLREDNVQFENLKNKILIKNWHLEDGLIEKFTFEDNSDVLTTNVITGLISSKQLEINGTNDDDDILEGSLGDDIIYGFSGNDRINGQTGNDILNGGAGDDIIFASQGSNILLGETGTDELRVTNNQYADTFIEGKVVSSMTNVLDGGIGNDNLEVNYSITNDTYLSENTFIGGEGDDRFLVNGNFDSSNVVLNNIIDAGPGNNEISMFTSTRNNSLNNNNSINTGDGVDKLQVQSYFDSTDVIFRNTIDTGGNDDELQISTSFKNSQYEMSNIISTGSGDEKIQINSSNYHDIYDFTNKSSSELLLDTGDGDDEVSISSNNFNSVVNNDMSILTGDGNDRVNISSGLNNQVFQNEGQSVVNFLFDGGLGDDQVGYSNFSQNAAVISNTTILGGEGNDALHLDSSYYKSDVELVNFIDSGTGNDSISFSVNINETVYVMNNEILAGEGDDRVSIYTYGSNAIYGEDGNDLISLTNVEAFDSTIKNIIDGGSGNDTLMLNSKVGGNTIIGGTGDDTLIGGGEGDNTFIFNLGDGNDSIKNSKTNDTLSLGVGISQSDITLTLVENNLVIDINQESITLIDWLLSPSKFDSVLFEDGSYLDKTLFSDLNIAIQTTPPLVLDFNNNAITSISLDNSNTYFDYNGDGSKEHTAWIESGDALLAVDINKDGKINDASELFGNYTKLENGTLAVDGYEALLQYDTNSDGVINRKDSDFGNLLLWKDINQNGKSEEGELLNIQLSTVTSIHLYGEDGVTFEQFTENGNLISNETNYTTDNGNGLIRDVWFNFDPNSSIAVNDDFYTYNKDDGEYVISENDSGNDTLNFGTSISREDLIVRWDKANNGLNIKFEDNSNDKVIINNWFDDTSAIENFTFEDGTTLSKEALYDLLLSTKEDKVLTARVLEENGTLVGGHYNDLLYGSTGEERLEGGAGDDYLKGLSEDDFLIGGAGDDILNGGIGDDILAGEDGDDYYIFNRGDGKDLIQETFGNDTIILGENLTQDDLIIQRDGNDLLIGIKDGDTDIFNLSDLIRIENQFYRSLEVESLELYTGEVIELPRGNYTPTITNSEELNTLISMQDTRQTNGTVKAYDVNADTLSYSITTQSQHGVVVIDELGNWNYQVESGYIGNDSVVVTIDDGSNTINSSVTQTINFESKVSSPTLEDVTENLLEDTPSTNTLTTINPIGGVLTYEIVTPTTNGIFTLDDNGTYTYNPSQDYNGLDNVILKVTNEYNLSTTSTISFDIEAVNDAPVINNSEALSELIVLHDIREQEGTLDATDVDGDILSYSVTTQAQHGVVVIDELGNWNYSVEEGYIGDDSVTITVSDNSINNNINQDGTPTDNSTITQTINFSSNITPPQVSDYELTTLEDEAFSGTIEVINPSNAILSYTISTQPQHGVVTIDTLTGLTSYTPSQDYNGNDSLAITVTNEYGQSSTSNITFDVEAVNDTPTIINEATDFTLTNIRDIEGSIEANDVDGDVLNYTITTQALHGVVTIDDNGNWSYKADAAYNGNDSVTITVDDNSESNNSSVSTTLNFTIEGYTYTSGDLVIDDNTNDNSSHTLVMSSISKEMMSFEKHNDDLILNIDNIDSTDSNGTITIKDYFIDASKGINTITTSNGDINLSKDVINNASTSFWRTGYYKAQDASSHLILGTNKSDYLRGNSGDDILFGNNKYDFLDGYGGNDLLVGGDYKDRLYGGSGDDNLYGDKGNDNLYGESGNDALMGGVGRDKLYAGLGDDFLYGGTGRDNLYGDSGDDFLSGGKDKDKLYGGSGDDTYFFEKGDGNDTITDYKKKSFWKTEDAGDDTILFGESITKEDISFTMKRGNLYLDYGSDGIESSIKVNDQDSSKKRIEKFELSDGSFLTHADVELVIQQLHAYADDNGIHRITNDAIKANEAMMNIVSSAWHS
jgi:trimeric autotransporter adhesin